MQGVYGGLENDHRCMNRMDVYVGTDPNQAENWGQDRGLFFMGSEIRRTEENNAKSQTGSSSQLTTNFCQRGFLTVIPPLPSFNLPPSL